MTEPQSLKSSIDRERLIAVALQLKAGATTLVAEAEKLGVTSERLRGALRALLGDEVYALLMRAAAEAKSPGRKAFSWKRQKRLDRLLSGEGDGHPHSLQEASPQTTQEMWDALAGEGGPRSPPPETRSGNPLGRQQPDTGAGPFTRGDDTRGPFDRRN